MNHRLILIESLFSPSFDRSILTRQKDLAAKEQKGQIENVQARKNSENSEAFHFLDPFPFQDY